MVIPVLAGLVLAVPVATQVPSPSALGVRYRLAEDPDFIVGDDTHYIGALAGALRLEDGTLLVADGQLQTVRAFRSDGSLAWTAGRSGQGPGEFRSIFGMWLTPDGRIGLWDARLRRITYLSRDGDVLETWPIHSSGMPLVEGNLEAFMGAFDDGAILLGSLSPGLDTDVGPGEPMPDRWVIAQVGAKGALEHVVTTLRGMRRMTQPLPFSAMAYAVPYDDYIFAIDDEGDRLLVLGRSGQIYRTLELGIVADIPSDPLRALRRELERRGREMYLDALSQIPPSTVRTGIPRVAGILVDPVGLVWVKRFAAPDDSIWLRSRAHRPAPGGAWVIYRPDGTEVAVVEMPVGFVPMHVSPDAVTGSIIDALGVERVAVFRLQRGP